MCITDISKHGLFKAADCAYSATAIEAVKEMQDFNNKSFWEKARVVNDALGDKHP